MKIINTKGITYFEPLEGTTQWHWGTDYIHGDLYEAEQLFRQGHTIKSNTLLFLSYPQGEIIEPTPPKAGQYFGRPIYHEGHITLLLVDFIAQQIKIEAYAEKTKTTKTIATVPLSAVADCYNLMLKTAPLMLTRQGQEPIFELLYPNQLTFPIKDHESFAFRENDVFYFTLWWEKDDVYCEEVILRDVTTGAIRERKNGSLRTMPDGQVWLLG